MNDDDEYGWSCEHWWSNYHELRAGSQFIASLQVKGSKGIAELGSRRYVLKRVRWPAAITLRNEESDDLVARLLFLPVPLRIEFEDGEIFRLGWTSFWKSQWAWTRNDGDTVLRLDKSRLHPGPDDCSNDKLVMLMILQKALGTLSTPWF